ncbi:hypothetical protein BJX64DRAFT_252570 [Aspergillus heterothallicus]
MSFYLDDRLPQSSASPSAQPYRSLFGGSSQDVVDQQRQLRFHRDESLAHTDVGATTDGGPDTAEEEFDDDDAYISEIDASGLPLNDDLSHSGTRRKSTFANREYTESSQSPPSYRPNRFHGPADMWLKLTRDDREIVEALDEIRARDLAAHLYNADTLQSRRVANFEDPNEPKDDHGDDTCLRGGIEQWTAWPMPSDEVPRPDERLRRLEDDKWTYRLKPDPRPSAGLEESIIALLLKTAKDRFHSREWDSSSAKKGDMRYSKHDGVRAKIEAGHESDKQNTDGRQLANKPDADDRNSETEWDSEQENLRLPQRPTFQIDEDISRQKLRPLARNVITNFEYLLRGLHQFHGSLSSEERSRSRRAKRGRSSSWASDKSSVCSEYAPQSASEAESNGAHLRTTTARKKWTKPKTYRSQSRGRNPARATSNPQRHGNNSGETQTPGPRSSSRASYIQSGLTDWKDVLGVASMVGLSPAVLRRAMDRFSALSNEDTTVTLIPDGSNEDFIEDVLRWASSQYTLTASEGKNSLGSDLESHSPSLGALSTSGRSTSPANYKARKRKAMKGNTADNEKTLVCPFRKCPRHEKGFSRVWNLNQHLKNMHPNYQAKGDGSRKRRGVQSRYESEII